MAKATKADEAAETKGLRSLTQDEAQELATLIEVAVNTNTEIEAILKRIYPGGAKNASVKCEIPKSWHQHIESTGNVKGKYALPCTDMLGGIWIFALGAKLLAENLQMMADGNVDNLEDE